jgi:O-antigen ligase
MYDKKVMEKGKTTNIYDKLIICAIALLAGGGIGGAIQLVRIFAVLAMPILLAKIGYCKKIRQLIQACLMFWLFCVVSLIWSADASEGIKEISYYFVHFCLFFEIIVFAYNAKKPLFSIGMGWLIFVLICSVIALWEMTTGQHLAMAYEESNFFNDGGIIVNRIVASVTFANYNTYVTILCMALPWIFFLYVYEESSLWLKSLSALLIMFSFVTILISGSRGGFISMIIMALIFLINFNKKTNKLFFIFIVLLLVIPFILNFKDNILLVFLSRESITSEFGRAGLEGGRTGIWLTSLKALIGTIGIGVGCGGIQQAILEYRSNIGLINAPHNMFVEFLSQYGVIWFGILIAFLLKVFAKTRKIANNQIKLPLRLTLFAMLVYMAIDSMYLLKPGLFVLFASIYIFANHNYFDKAKLMR